MMEVQQEGGSSGRRGVSGVEEGSFLKVHEVVRLEAEGGGALAAGREDAGCLSGGEAEEGEGGRRKDVGEEEGGGARNQEAEGGGGSRGKEEERDVEAELARALDALALARSTQEVEPRNPKPQTRGPKLLLLLYYSQA